MHECLGGPVDGVVMDKSGHFAVAIEGKFHYYRFCVIKQEKTNKVAKFFHYVGTKWPLLFVPRLIPNARAFRLVD